MTIRACFRDRRRSDRQIVMRSMGDPSPILSVPHAIRVVHVAPDRDPGHDPTMIAAAIGADPSCDPAVICEGDLCGVLDGDHYDRMP